MAKTLRADVVVLKLCGPLYNHRQAGSDISLPMSAVSSGDLRAEVLGVLSDNSRLAVKHFMSVEHEPIR